MQGWTSTESASVLAQMRFGGAFFARQVCRSVEDDLVVGGRRWSVSAGHPALPPEESGYGGACGCKRRSRRIGPAVLLSQVLVSSEWRSIIVGCRTGRSVTDPACARIGPTRSRHATHTDVPAVHRNGPSPWIAHSPDTPNPSARHHHQRTGRDDLSIRWQRHRQIRTRHDRHTGSVLDTAQRRPTSTARSRCIGWRSLHWA